jgi:thioredoxin reductase (NADPH)
MADLYDIIIIGSGPSGYTAALYASRANLKVLQFQGYTVGGQLMLTSDVENYPGFVHGILGPEMMDKFEEQAKRFGTEMIARDVVAVDFSREPFHVTADGIDEPYRADAVIIATGASAKWLGLPNEQRLQGRGVSACATCDGAFFREQQVAVIGGGDTAMEEALFLTKFASKVYVVHRRDKLRASKIMQDRAFADEKIKFIWDTEVVEVLGGDAVTGLRLRNRQGEESVLDVSGMFVAIGHDPRSELIRGQVELDPAGYVVVDAPSTRTNLSGVFACGDLVDHTYRQAITAAGTGCAAALDAERWLEARAAAE